MAQGPVETALHLSSLWHTSGYHCSRNKLLSAPGLNSPYPHIPSGVAPQTHLGPVASTAAALHSTSTVSTCPVALSALASLVHAAASFRLISTPSSSWYLWLHGMLGHLSISQLAQHWIFLENLLESKCGSL